MRKEFLLRMIWLIAAIGLITGCATGAGPRSELPQRPVAEQPAQSSPTLVAEGTDAPVWHSCRIRMARKEDGSVRWPLDALLAHRVFAPVLEKHAGQISLWRFHRRAGNDAAGHRFSFIFYAPPPVAEQLASQVLASPLLNGLQARALVTLAQCDSSGGWSGPGVGDTSDPSWAPEIQRAWPAFIMGSSQFWLNMIDEVVEPAVEPAIEDEPLEATLARFEQANERLTRLWTEQGQHALLHHLNAIFGYRPMLIRY